MGQARRARLARVGSRRELVDRLYGMNDPPKGQKAGERTRERTTGLRTYILECNEIFQSGKGDRVSWEVEDTGVDRIKTLNVWKKRATTPLQFYMDMADGRFFLLHTDEPAKGANHAVEGLAGDHGHKFDHAWFHSGLMKKWARSLGAGLCGYSISHGGALAEKDDTLKMRVGGTSAKGPHDALAGIKGAGRLLSHEAIEVRGGTRGPAGAFVEERIANTGCFAIRRGRSIEAHLDIVERCKNEYKKMVTSVERCRLGTSTRDGGEVFEGRPLAITYPEVSNLAQFIDTMFNAKKPFKLWGIKILRKEGQYSVPAVDLHEGSAINFEITSRMMRIYLEKGSRGSAILRLLTNLQAHYSAQAECGDLE